MFKSSEFFNSNVKSADVVFILLLCLTECKNVFYGFCVQVLHLESSNAAMAEDLLTKTAIIQHYVMETKSGIVKTMCFLC